MIATISFGAFAQNITAVDATGTVNGKEFLLETATEKYLAVDANGNLVVLAKTALNNPTLAALEVMKWKVSVKGGVGTTDAVYSFVNVGTGLELALHKDRAAGYSRPGTGSPANALQGDVKDFIASSGKTTASTNYFYYTVESDSIVSLSVDGSAVILKAYENRETLIALAEVSAATNIASLKTIADKQNTVAVNALNAVPSPWTNTDDHRATLAVQRTNVRIAKEVIEEAASAVGIANDDAVITALTTAYNADGATGTSWGGYYPNNSENNRFFAARDYTRGLADAIKAVAAKIALVDNGGPVVVNDDILRLTPKVATGNIALSANDMNTYLGKVGVMDANGLWATSDSRFTLDYSPKKITIDSEFQKANGKFHAIAVNDNNVALANGYKDNVQPWMFLNIDGGENYLVVDTLATGGTEQGNNDRLQFNKAKLADASKATKPRLLASYVFGFHYDAATGKIYGVSKEYVEKKNGNVSATHTWGENTAYNVISLAELGDEKTAQYSSAATVGADTLWFKLNADATYTPITLTPGAYLIKVVGTGNPEAYRNGKYWIRNLCGDFEYVSYDKAVQEFQHMPSAQWIIQSKNDKTAMIQNREYAYSSSYNTTYGVKGADGKLIANQFFTIGGDTLELTKVEDIKAKKLGYFYEEGLNSRIDAYTLRFLNALSNDLPVNLRVDADNDSLLVINKDGEELYFRVKEIASQKYGWGLGDENVLKDIARLERSIYTIGLYSSIDRENEAKAWVSYNTNKKRFEIVSNGYAQPFYFKEWYEVEGEKENLHYYVMATAYKYGDTYGFWGERVEVDHRSLDVVSTEICNSVYDDVNVAAFRLAKRSDILYRTVTDKDDEAALEQNIRLYRVKATEKEYLYEDANSVYSTPVNGDDDKNRKGQINFLGFQGKGDNDVENTVFTARYVRGKIMPQYMLFVDYDTETTTDVVMCPICKEEGKTEPDPNCIHDEKVTTSVVKARMLVNFADSVNKEFNGVKDAYKYQTHTRLGFIDVTINEKDSVLTWNNWKATADGNIKDKGIRYIYNTTKEKIAQYAYLDTYKQNNYLFSFRLIDEESDDFLIESVGNGYGTPNGEWIQKLNGVPVLTGNVSFYDPNSQAEIFNWDLTDLDAVSNEGPAAGEVKVYGAAGVVTVTGAAGEAVVITDVLGKVIANTVINSDAATFSAPAGVAIVKVAGEAQKVLVK